MTKSHAPLSGPLAGSLLGLAFCVWTALGNEVNICVTTGCTLYADSSLAGISLWWYGTAAFTILAIFALLGQARIGRILAGIMLSLDICLLGLMAITAPCVSCLVAALLFALCYWLFRRKNLESGRQNSPLSRMPSALLWTWLVLFIINIGQIARSQVDIWPIMDESGEPVTRIFFSPTCPYCIEGVNALSGNINAAFYPVAENDQDVAKIKNMQMLIENGENIASALAQSEDVYFSDFWSGWAPSVILLRFRLLCNKAHLFSQGSQGVPFFEHKGLMPGLVKKTPPVGENSLLNDTPARSASENSPSSGDATLPVELRDALQCGGNIPCPPG